MNDVVVSLNGFSQAWAVWMFQMSCQLALFAALIYLLTRLFRGGSSNARKWLWMLVFVKLLLPPGLYAPWSMGTLLTSLADSPEQSVTLTQRVFTPVFQPEPGEGATLSGTVETSAGEDAPKAHPLRRALEGTAESQTVPSGIGERSALTLTSWAMFVWFGGAVGLLAAAAFRYQRFVRGTIERSLPASEETEQLAQTLCVRMGVQARVAIRMTLELDTPAVVGLFRPVVLIPVDWEQVATPEERTHVLAHEIAHVKRGDAWLSLVTAMGCLALWFHPVLWWVDHNVRREREMACDKLALKHTQAEPDQYANTLVHVAERFRGCVPAGAGLLGVFETAGRLLERIRAVRQNPTPGRVARAAAWASFAAALLLLPMAALPACDGNEVDAIQARLENLQPSANPPKAYVRFLRMNHVNSPDDGEPKGNGPILRVHQGGRTSDYSAVQDGVVIKYLSDGCYPYFPYLPVDMRDSNRSLVTFDLRELNKRGPVDRAELVLDMRSSSVPVSAPFEIVVCPITAPWDASQVTWNKQPAHAMPYVIARMSPAPGIVAIDVSPLVSAWTRGKLKNHGLLLKIAVPVKEQQVVASATSQSGVRQKRQDSSRTSSSARGAGGTTRNRHASSNPPKSYVRFISTDHARAPSDGEPPGKGPILRVHSSGRATDYPAVRDNVLLEYLADRCYWNLPYLPVDMRGKNRSIMSFDLSTMARRDIIERAELVLDMRSSPLPVFAPFEMAVCAVTEAWDVSRVMWNNQPSHSKSYTIASLNPAPGIVEVDVTSLVREWVGGSLVNHGLMLRIAAPVGEGAVSNDSARRHQPGSPIVTHPGHLSRSKTANESNDWVYFVSNESGEGGPPQLLITSNRYAKSYPVEDDVVLISYLADQSFSRHPSLSLSVGDTNRVLVGFDVSRFSRSRKIVKAELVFDMKLSADPPVEPFNVAVYPVLEPWVAAGVTWENQPKYLSVPEAMVTLQPRPGSVRVDVTRIVKEWRSGESANYGLLLKASGL